MRSPRSLLVKYTPTFSSLVPTTALLAAALVSCNSDPPVVEPGPVAKTKPKVPPIPDVPPDPYARPPGGQEAKAVVAMNKDPRRAPPNTARPGSGEPIDAPFATTTSNGFEIRFATGSPVPTPTIHDGRLIVSGGFNSREIFAYSATTGSGQWGRTLSDDGPSNAVCEGQTCVFNSESCTTFAVNEKTGKVLWSWWLGDPQTSAPTLANGRVFASYPAYGGAMPAITDDLADAPKPPLPTGAMPTGATHVIGAFDLKTGKPLWRKWLDADVMSAPVAVGDFLYLTTFAGTVMKIDQATGDIRYAVAMRATSAPVIVRDAKGNEQLHITRRVEERPDETKEAIIRADVGATRLTYRAHAKLAPYLDGKVQRNAAMTKQAQVDDSENGFSSVPSAANAGVAAQTVGLANVSTLQRFQGSRVLVAGGMVYSTMGDEVIAIDSESGEVKWRYALAGNTATEGGHLGTAPLVAGNDIVVATLSGNVVRLDAKTGKLNATYKTGAPLRSQPAVMGGWIYLGSEDGRLIAIDTHDKSLTGWPTWGGDNGRTAVRL
ncbi:MAG TPA: PQQ-binding-like beta-propeller repeat protein [Kofleriaceae bacterium]|nr:PQQ-binding-like beta-propeller repeat protein [Kofleriaceae bacterium]